MSSDPYKLHSTLRQPSIAMRKSRPIPPFCAAVTKRPYNIQNDAGVRAPGFGGEVGIKLSGALAVEENYLIRSFAGNLWTGSGPWALGECARVRDIYLIRGDQIRDPLGSWMAASCSRLAEVACLVRLVSSKGP